MTIPYPMPDPVTEDTDGNIVPVRNIIPRRGMNSQGRQYPDGPLEPPPGWVSVGADFAKGVCESRPVPSEFWPDSAGEFLHNMYGGSEPEPGPPYVHTFRPPEPEYDDEGNQIWHEPDPAFTLKVVPNEYMRPGQVGMISAGRAPDGKMQVSAAVLADGQIRHRTFTAEDLEVLRISPGPAASSLPDSPYRSEVMQDEPTRCWSGP